MDNAVDFLETQRNSVSQKRRIAYEIIPAVAQIEVTISKQIDFLSIVVSNSNEYGKSVFSKDRLHSIFDFDTFYSSKRSQYKITRGALGDAFKEILCTPYALVGIQQEQQSHTGWNEPLIMRTKINKTLQTFFVILITDKVNQTIHTKIVEQKEDEEEKSKLSPQSPQQQPNFTEIEVRLPIVKNILDIAKLRRFLLDYTTFNTRIDLAPFVDLVAETTVKACSGGLNSRISLARINGGIEGDDTSVIGRLRRLLRQRFDSVKQDPSLIDRQKWTQSTVFYRLRQILLSYGYSNEEIDRQYITSQIKAVCEENLGVKCEEIGITTADRAQLYFKGKYHDVGLEISDLVEYGTDMLIVEKEGVVKTAGPIC